MAIEVNVPNLGSQFLDMAGISDNGTFTYPTNQEITTGDLMNLIHYHQQYMRRKYEKEFAYYKGDHDIKRAPAKPLYKPDNRIILNFPRKVITTYNGFFLGNPIKINAEDKSADKFIADWCDQVNFDAVASEVSKQSAMYGRAYFLVYQSDAAEGEPGFGMPEIAAIRPTDGFVIYDDSYAHRPKYGVLYRFNYEHKLEITLYDDHVKRDLVDNGGTGESIDQAKATANPYLMVPLIEADENSEHMGVCEDIISLIDALDNAVSEKANDNDYFADAMLKIVNARIDKSTEEEMRDKRVLQLTGASAKDASVDYLSKPDADTTQEHLIDRLVRSIYEIANITNLNDDAFNGNPSGVSLKLKYQAMDNMARAKTLTFKSTLRNLFRCVCAVSFDSIAPDTWQNLKFKFVRTIPVNLLEESQAAANLYGKVSNRTLFGQLSFIDDPDEEMAQIKKEQQDAMQGSSNIMQQALAASQTDQQKAGAVNDNGQARTVQNQPNSGAGQPSNKPAR